MNTATFWHEVAQRLDNGARVFVSLVAANTDGSPGTLGARLLVDDNGGVAGTIGGGIMEMQLVKEAHRRLQNGPVGAPELRQLVHRKKGTDHPSGLICSGEQTNINLVLEPERDCAAIRRFIHALAAHDNRATILVIDAQGLRVTPAADESQALSGMTLSATGSDWCYHESSINPKRLAIVGGGHCGKALANLAVQIGYSVDVFDDRQDVLNGPEWPNGARCHVLADYGELDSRLHYPALTTMVVMTASVLHDIAALAAVAPARLQWLGVMGSTAKIQEIHKQLGSRGVDRSYLDTIHGPIGLPMKSDTPSEIAVSIMGQLLARQKQDLRSESTTHTSCRNGS